MSNYYLNRYKIREEDLLIEKADEPSMIEDHYNTGESLNLDDERPKYYFAKKDAQMLDLVPGGQFPLVVSKRLKSLFLQCDISHLEFHPVDLICQEDESVIESYFLMNILDNVACLDRDKSNYDLFHPEYDIIVSISKLVLDDSKIGQRDIFRIAEYPTLVIYSNELKNKIADADLRGFNFIDVGKHRPV